MRRGVEDGVFADDRSPWRRSFATLRMTRLHLMTRLLLDDKAAFDDRAAFDDEVVI